MAATFSTYAQTSQGVAQNNTDTSDTTVTSQGDLQTQTQDSTTATTTASDTSTQTVDNQTQTQSADTTTQTDASVVEDNVSSFSLGSDDTTTQVNGTAQATAPQAPVFNIDEEIKKIDRKELAAKLGITEFALEMSDYQAKGGKASDYVAARAIDYNTIPDESIVKEGLKEKFPNFTAEEINRIYARKYGVDDSLTDEEKEDKLLDLKAEAFNIRNAKIENQKNFKFPDPLQVQDENYTQWKEARDQQAALSQQINNYFNEHTATKALNESKRVVINLGEGVEPFKFVIDKPELITNAIMEVAPFRQPTLTKTGEPDVASEQLKALFNFNPQKFIQDIFNYGKTVASRSKVAEGQNATRPNTVVTPTATATTTYRAGTFGS